MGNIADLSNFFVYIFSTRAATHAVLSTPHHREPISTYL